MSLTIHQSLSACTRLSGNCGSLPLLTSCRGQRRSCNASAKPTTSPIETFAIRKADTSATSMCFGHLARLAVKTYMFRCELIGKVPPKDSNLNGCGRKTEVNLCTGNEKPTRLTVLDSSTSK